MHYYQHDIGVFAVQTRFMMPEEVGIFVILKDMYLANGMPIACDRIANVMPPQCEASLQKVLQRFFVLEDGFYRCEEFDKELAGYSDKGETNRKNAKKGWEKRRAASEPNANVCESHASRTESHAKTCLINNQELLINNQINKHIHTSHDACASACASVPDEPLWLDDIPACDELTPEYLDEALSEPETKSKAKRATSAKKGTRLSAETLPDDWRTFCESEDPELDPGRVWNGFRDYWTAQAGQKGVKLDWLATWRTWVRSFRGADAWKRNPVLRTLPTHKSKFVQREKLQRERDYTVGWD